MKRPFILLPALILIFAGSTIQAQMIANITSEVETEFGTYLPIPVSFTPAVPDFSLNADFSNVTNWQNLQWQFNESEKDDLQQHHFLIRTSTHKQMFDIYNACTWNSMPVFVTADAVLHTYHVLFDHILTHLEMERFVLSLDQLTKGLIDEIQVSLDAAQTEPAKEALKRNLAFLHVADALLERQPRSIQSAEVENLVQAELDLIAKQDNYYYSPIFGEFSELDYSQLKPRGHYTKNDTLKAYFKSMMWYGWTIFTMEPKLFGDLSPRHTLQAIILTQKVYGLDKSPALFFKLWENIYEPTVFMVGKTDDPTLFAYKEIGEQIYGQNFLELSADELADAAKLQAFMVEAQKLPEPKIPNYIKGSPTTYKGFRFMGQRFIPDSYMFANFISLIRTMPRGLDIMFVLGSDRAKFLLDSVYADNTHFNKLDEFRAEFESKTDADWAQNLYWNWLYCLMPMLYEKGDGYPFYMQTQAWMDRELMAALASWAELRHDTILYGKQSGSFESVPPEPARSAVEPNPHIFARLAALVQFTMDGLDSRNLPYEEFREKLLLFKGMLLFFKDMAIKELENVPLTNEESDLILGFGDAMQQLVSIAKNPQEPWDKQAENMAVIADVHTDPNTNECLEEGVGYPLEMDVIVYEGGSARICRGALFSYYEFKQPIADRLTDEKWREMLFSDTPPVMPEWVETLLAAKSNRPAEQEFLSESARGHAFTSVNSPTALRTPIGFNLFGNYPNPFNPTTTIRFELSKRSLIEIAVYNLLGARVRTLVAGDCNAGTHLIRWEGLDETGRAVSGGVYVVRFWVNGQGLSQKMTLLR